ncbi:hypothetical protein [Amycolatopsis australiensis]|uniref:Uncharacterized protein n=1 Tax=Amycolatopsis australiensis TaxID=546364 RepID=A0A1K1RFI5_9PSEU|nr:hypothetical protein [Amycolatopsis australiensis]SFW71018.1 hypothetical protein SAMN04489730_3206 [Amycolatopsis australiensis]
MSDRGDARPAAGKARRGSVIKAVPPHDVVPNTRELQERAKLADEVAAALGRVRSTAQNWRTGMAGLITLVTATLLFKGRNSISDYVSWVRYSIGALTALALIAGVASLWWFLLAAYGRPEVVSAQSVIDQGGVAVRDVLLAQAARKDLKFAQLLAIVSAALLAAALILSWYGPAETSSPPAFASVKVRHPSGTEAICGSLVAQNGTTTELRVKGEPDARRIPTADLVSVVLVSAC